MSSELCSKRKHHFHLVVKPKKKGRKFRDSFLNQGHTPFFYLFKFFDYFSSYCIALSWFYLTIFSFNFSVDLRYHTIRSVMIKPITHFRIGNERYEKHYWNSLNNGFSATDSTVCYVIMILLEILATEMEIFSTDMSHCLFIPN